MEGPLIAYVDGASRGNPGAAAFGVCVCAPDGSEVACFGGSLGRQTNNYAEYRALIAALRWASEQRVTEFEVRSDSQLMVRQMEGRYRVKSPGLKPLHAEARALVSSFERFRIVHLRRENNAEADSIANRVLDGDPDLELR